VGPFSARSLVVAAALTLAFVVVALTLALED
jgi:hypothetical protein